MLKQVTVWTEPPRGGHSQPFPGLVNTDKVIWGQVTRRSDVDVPLVMLVLEGADKDNVLIVEGVPEDFMERVWVGSGWAPDERLDDDLPYGNSSARVIYDTPQP